MPENFICTSCHGELTSQPEYHAVYSHITDSLQLTLYKKVHQGVGTYNIWKNWLVYIFLAKSHYFGDSAPTIIVFTKYVLLLLTH